jgi:hypothetical protein
MCPTTSNKTYDKPGWRRVSDASIRGGPSIVYSSFTNIVKILPDLFLNFAASSEKGRRNFIPLSISWKDHSVSRVPLPPPTAFAIVPPLRLFVSEVLERFFRFILREHRFTLRVL